MLCLVSLAQKTKKGGRKRASFRNNSSNRIQGKGKGKKERTILAVNSILHWGDKGEGGRGWAPIPLGKASVACMPGRKEEGQRSRLWCWRQTGSPSVLLLNREGEGEEKKREEATADSSITPERGRASAVNRTR